MPKAINSATTTGISSDKQVELDLINMHISQLEYRRDQAGELEMEEYAKPIGSQNDFIIKKAREKYAELQNKIQQERDKYRKILNS